MCLLTKAPGARLAAWGPRGLRQPCAPGAGSRRGKEKIGGGGGVDRLFRHSGERETNKIRGKIGLLSLQVYPASVNNEHNACLDGFRKYVDCTSH